MSRIIIAAVLALVALIGVPSSALAHQGHRDPSARHKATDLPGVPFSTFERRARAMTRKLGRRPGTRPKSERLKAKASAVTDPGAVGRWSAVKPAPVVPVHEALLPNGKVLMWDSVGDEPTENYADQTYTRAAVYDPVTETSKRVDVEGTNIFCAGYVQLANGNVFVAGGNADAKLNGARTTHTFDWRTETWTRGPDMQDGRWYPSVAAMPNDEAVIIGGGPTVAEVRTSTGAIRRPTGLTTPSSRLYPFLQTSTDGRALMLGPWTGMYLGDPFGNGTTTYAGVRDSIDRGYGSFAPYDYGKSLVSGGGSVNEQGRKNVPTRTAVVVDTRSGAPVGQGVKSMSVGRRQHQLTVLADGSVVATGGQTTNGGNGLVDLNNASYAAERWDPATGAWKTLASAAVARQYHSTAMLLPDGRVLTGGGGICSECHKVGYLRRDVEVFSPPYLFKRDGSGALASRPVLDGVPGTVGYDGSFTMSSAQAAGIRKVGLVRLGAPTHAMDQGQRYVPLPFTVSGSTLTVSAPVNPNEAPAGTYMLFAVDANGVPSVASMVSVQRPAAPPSTTADTNLAVGQPVVGDPPCGSAEGPEKAVNGSFTGGPADKWCSYATNATLRVDLGASRTLTSFTVRHAGAGGESPTYNTRDFKIETSEDGTTWSPATAVAGNTADSTSRTITPRSARYARLVVTYGEQTRSGPTRIYEFEVYGQSGSSVSPVPVALHSELNAGGRAQRFEAGRYEAPRGNLGQIGNDAARSAVIAPGYEATLCVEGTLTACTTLPAGRYDSLPAGYDLAVSSLRVRRAG